MCDNQSERVRDPVLPVVKYVDPDDDTPLFLCSDPDDDIVRDDQPECVRDPVLPVLLI